jgi:hypothetical protein
MIRQYKVIIHFFSIFFILLLSCSLFHDNNKQKYRLDKQTEFDSNGIETKVFNYIYSDDKKISRINTLEYGILTGYSLYDLNGDGSLLKTTNYDLSDSITSSYFYEYDSSKNKILTVSLEYPTSNTNIVFTYFYNYLNEKIKIIATSTIDNSLLNYQTFSYSSGKVIESNRFDSSNNLTGKTLYEYGSNNLIKIIYYDNSNSIIYFRTMGISENENYYDFMLYGRW